jgi:hypothetical protein
MSPTSHLLVRSGSAPVTPCQDGAVPILDQFRSTAASVATLVALPLLSGCGEPEEALSRAEYIVQADRICLNEVTVTSTGRIGKMREARLPLEGSASFNRDLAEDKEGVLADLQALASPEEERAAIESWLAARKEQIELLREGATAQETHDGAQLNALSDQFTAARRREFAAATDFGMKVCSRPPGGAQVR